MRVSEVSVIVLTRNSEETLAGCLESIVRGGTGEIFAIDAESTDQTREILKEYGVRTLVDKRHSLGYARQLGLESATGCYVMFVDSDVEIARNCIPLLLSDLEKSDWVGVHAKLLSARGPSYWERCQNLAYVRQYGAPGPRESIDTICAMFRRDILLEIGFDSFFKESAEDVDICIRLKTRRFALGVSRAVAYHHHRLTFTAFAQQRFRNGIGVARLSVKHDRKMICDPVVAALSETLRSINLTYWKMIPFWIASGVLISIGILYGLGIIAQTPSLTDYSVHQLRD